MTPRHHTTRQDNWSYRPGYQNTPRVPGPIWHDGDRIWLGALLCLTSAVVAIGGLVWVWSALS